MNRVIYLPSHKDAGNRGCEAITRGTAKILNDLSCEIIGFSNNVKLDTELGLNQIVSLYPMRTREDENLFDKVQRKVRQKMIFNSEEEKIFKKGYFYKKLLRQITAKDIALSTGGDMFCYENNEVIYINNYLHKRGIKTILWGCSIGKENLTSEKIDTLKKFSVITARETMTQKVLQGIGLKNVYCYPDPAFVLEAERCELPKKPYAQNTVGINLSNFVGENVGFDTDFGKNLLYLFEYIIKETKYNVLLIPHVFWKGQDDRIICDAFYEKYRETNRVFRLETETMNYCQIRYAISQCSFFIGARTHAMISAYSTAVPALALGYSIKARGIAADLGLSEELVIDWKSLRDKEELTCAFINMVNNEAEIKNVYKQNLEDYKKLAYNAKFLFI